MNTLFQVWKSGLIAGSDDMMPPMAAPPCSRGARPSVPMMEPSYAASLLGGHWAPPRLAQDVVAAATVAP